jgi:ribonuclease R
VTSQPFSAHGALEQIARDLELDAPFSPEVLAETAALLASPGLDDRRLVDLTQKPYCTIDGATSKDLDQALCIERRPGGGFLVGYAIADAAYYVPQGSALFAGALARGASYYFPGFSLPMLPRELSEGLVSLNPGTPRRALVFSMFLDAAGNLEKTELARARIVSRRKLAWGDVQRFYDAPSESDLSSSPLAESLELLRQVGELRIRIAEAEDVVRYRRREIEVQIAGDKMGFVVLDAVRDQVELYNEQISILCNREAGRLLAEHPAPHLQPIYRVHPAPEAVDVAGFFELAKRTLAVHGLAGELDPREDEPVAAYLRRLPTSGPVERVARAIERQALLVNVRSAFATAPDIHHGVGAEVYARASSPMREVVGVFLHKELVEMLDASSSEAPGAEGDVALRDRVVEAANLAKDRQRRVNDLVNRLVLDRLFTSDLAAGVPPRVGTVMGITSSKVHVELDDPGLDVKVYLRDLGQARGGAWLDIADGGAALVVRGTGETLCRLGDEVKLVLVGKDTSRDRWRLDLAR